VLCFFTLNFGARASFALTASIMPKLPTRVIEDIKEELKITSEHVEVLHRAFGIWDKNGDGDISSKELGVIMRSLGKNPTDEECDDMITEIDFDGDCDGTISFCEYAQMMVKKMRATDSGVELSEAFGDFSKGAGSIGPAQLKEAFAAMGKPITDEEIAMLVREADTTGDGQVTKAEFERQIGIGMAGWPLDDPVA